jgi:hypothetical protein
MPLNAPVSGNINAVGEQFKHNVFKKAQAGFVKRGVKANLVTKQAGVARDKARADWAGSVNSTLKTAHTEYAKQAKLKAQQAGQAAKAQASGIKSGRVAPAPGAAPRTFAVGTPKAAKQAATMQQAQFKQQQSQVNFAHGEAMKMQEAKAKTMAQQVNFAHGQAIGEAKQRAKPVKTTAAKPQQVNTPPTAPATQAPSYPKAVHPGSSTQPLPNASAAHSLPDKPQTFTQGSWTAKPGGIASAGSHLEAWAATKSKSVQARRASQAAGGRDRNLAAAAREWEGAANQPLGNNTPKE